MSKPVCPLLSSSEKVLVVCEKPSVARDLGAVLGAGPDAGGYLPFPGGYISWARGHLLELAPPSGYREDWARWSWETLPMVPPDLVFQSVVKKGCAVQLGVLRQLYGKADVLVNACDAGREGELIWWEAMRFCGWGAGLAAGVCGPKKALRFWAQSNTPGGLTEAWEAMRPVSERQGLAEAAFARSEADWLLGMNGSRAATLCFPAPEDSKGRRGVWSVGRVQTPVLALICERDNEILRFVPKPFYEVRLSFGGQAPFEATLLVPPGVAPFVPEGEAPKEAKGFLKKPDAEAALARLLADRPGLWDIKDEEKPSSESPPLLFSLTDLQKWCNRVWGWEAARTLQAAQEAYESAKTLTYPRTDACHLPVDSKGKMDGVYASLRSGFLDSRVSLPAWSVKPSASSRASALFDDSKLTDHYAIVPTGVVPSDLSSDAGKVWLAVVRRFLTAFGPAAKAATLKRRCTRSAGPAADVAVASGKRYIDRGWLDADDLLAPLTGQSPKADPSSLGACPPQLPLGDGRLHEGKTTPPKHFTEATLLSVMENISSRLSKDEDEVKEAMSGKGLGTPATRAAIIELLIARAYIERSRGKGSVSLRATKSGHTLIGSLRSASLGFLTEPDLTADWETALSDMEKGSGGRRGPFLKSLVGEVGRVVDTLRETASRAPAGASGGPRPRVETSHVCPLSGKPVGDCGTAWEFPGFPGRIPKVIAGRPFSAEEVSEVLSGSPAGKVYEGFVSKKGTKFGAGLKPNFETKRFDFLFADRVSSDSGEACPVTGEPILDCGGFWKFPGRETKFWKTVAQRPLSLAEYCLLVKEGKTGVLQGFVSRKGNKFGAHLVLGKDGSVGFEFEGGPSRTPATPRMTGPGAKKRQTGCGEGALRKKKPKKSY